MRRLNGSSTTPPPPSPSPPPPLPLSPPPPALPPTPLPPADDVVDTFEVVDDTDGAADDDVDDRLLAARFADGEEAYCSNKR